MNQIGIYIIKNEINGKVYVGQTKNFERRKKQHLNRLQQNGYKTYNKLYPAVKKYGIENFKFYFIEVCSIEELNLHEIQWIKQHDSFNNGYNSTPGGHKTITYMTGKHHSESTKQKIKMTLIGRKDSEEIKLRKSISAKGRHPIYATLAKQRKVKCLESGEIFNSLLIAAKNIGRHSTGILSVLEGRQKSCGGLHWEEIKKEV